MRFSFFHEEDGFNAKICGIGSQNVCARVFQQKKTPNEKKKTAAIKVRDLIKPFVGFNRCPLYTPGVYRGLIYEAKIGRLKDLK